MLIVLFLLIPTMIVRIIGGYDSLDAKFSHNNNVISLQHKIAFDSLDILFTGNSYCYAGIIPKLFDSVGLKTMNLGIATCGPKFYELVINDYLQFAKQQPKAIFILLSLNTFSNDADNFVEYPIHRYLINPISHEQLIWRYNNYNCYIEYLIKSFKKGSTNLLKKHEIPDTVDFFKNRGFISTNVAATENDINEAAKLYEPLLNETFNTNRFNALVSFATFLHDKGIEVIFYELPSNRHSDYFNKEYKNKYQLALADLAKKFEIIPSLNLPRDIFYRDIDHLNADGATLVTNYLITSILNNPKHKNLFDLQK